MEEVKVFIPQSRRARERARDERETQTLRAPVRLSEEAPTLLTSMWALAVGRATVGRVAVGGAFRGRPARPMQGTATATVGVPTLRGLATAVTAGALSQGPTRSRRSAATAAFVALATGAVGFAAGGLAGAAARYPPAQAQGMKAGGPPPSLADVAPWVKELAAGDGVVQILSADDLERQAHAFLRADHVVSEGRWRGWMERQVWVRGQTGRTRPPGRPRPPLQGGAPPGACTVGP